MSKKIEVKIPFGDGKTPNKNGRIYPKEAMDEAVAKFKTGKVFLTNPITEFDKDVGVDLTQVRGVVLDADRNDTEITAKIEVCDDIMADLIESGSFDIVPNGLGDVDYKTGVVKNYELFSVSLTLDSAFGEPKNPTVEEIFGGFGSDDDLRPSEPTDEG